MINRVCSSRSMRWDLVRLRGVRQARGVLAITSGLAAAPGRCPRAPAVPRRADRRAFQIDRGRAGWPPAAGWDIAWRRSATAIGLRLAQIDNDTPVGGARRRGNRARVPLLHRSRGLAVFDTPLMRQDVPGPPPPMTPPTVDMAMLAGRINSLRTLAEATDGMAIVNSNNLAEGFTRVVADLSSYYLLGYYSTGKLDGRFHSISVRVKRPGVKVRARRGYLAATPAAAAATARAAASRNAAPVPALDTAEAEAGARAIEAAIAPLAGTPEELPAPAVRRIGSPATRHPRDAEGSG
jgi:hypothetical protein